MIRRCVVVAVAAVMTIACAGQRPAPAPLPPVDLAAIADGVQGALLVTEQAQAIEAAEFLAGAVPADLHCQVHSVLRRFSSDARLALRVIGDWQAAGKDRSKAIRSLVEASTRVVDRVAPHLPPDRVVAWRSALTIGTVAALAYDARRPFPDASPEVLARFVEFDEVLGRIEALARGECVP